MNKRSKKKMRLVRGLCATVLMLAIAGPAHALPPTNDEPSAPEEIESVPFTATSDNTEATSTINDPNCGNPGHTTWYSFSAGKTQRLVAHTEGSKYDTVLGVYTGSPGSFEHVACDNDSGEGVTSRLGFKAQESETYYFMVGSYNEKDADETKFTLRKAADVTIKVDDVAWFDVVTNKPVVTGTAFCPKPVDLTLNAQVTENQNGYQDSTSGEKTFVCNGKVRFRIPAASDNLSNNLVNVRVYAVFEKGSDQGRVPLTKCTDIGTLGPDTMQGTYLKDRLCSLDGNDRIFGKGGNDIIRSYWGSDTVYGDDGNDTIWAHDGNDKLFGGKGRDLLDGSDGFDRADGQAGSDRCTEVENRTSC